MLEKQKDNHEYQKEGIDTSKRQRNEKKYNQNT